MRNLFEVVTFAKEIELRLLGGGYLNDGPSYFLWFVLFHSLHSIFLWKLVVRSASGLSSFSESRLPHYGHESLFRGRTVHHCLAPTSYNILQSAQP